MSFFLMALPKARCTVIQQNFFKWFFSEELYIIKAIAGARQKRCAKDSQAESGLTDRLEKKPLCLSSFRLKKNAEVTFALKRLINRHSKDTAS